MVQSKNKKFETVVPVLKVYESCSLLKSITDGMGQAVLETIKREYTEEEGSEDQNIYLFLDGQEYDFEPQYSNGYASAQHLLSLLANLLKKENLAELSRWVGDVSPLMAVPHINNRRLIVSPLFGDGNRTVGRIGFRFVEMEPIVRASMYRPVFYKSCL